MAYEVVMSYHLHMPSYFLGTFTEYPYLFFIRYGLHEKHGFHRCSLFFFCEIRAFRIIRT